MESMLRILKNTNLFETLAEQCDPVSDLKAKYRWKSGRTIKFASRQAIGTFAALGVPVNQAALY